MRFRRSWLFVPKTAYFASNAERRCQRRTIAFSDRAIERPRAIVHRENESNIPPRPARRARASFRYSRCCFRFRTRARTNSFFRPIFEGMPSQIRLGWSSAWKMA